MQKKLLFLKVIEQSSVNCIMAELFSYLDEFLF